MEWVKQRMEEARRQRARRQAGVHAGSDRLSRTAAGTHAAPRTIPLNPLWAAGLSAAWIATLLIAWMAGSGAGPVDDTVDDPGVTGGRASITTAEPASAAAASRQLERHLGELDRRIRSLNDVIASAEARLGRVADLTVSLPAPAGGPVAEQPPVPALPSGMPPGDAAGPAIAGVSAIPETGTRDAVPAESVKRWVVNLASLVDRDDAERFAAQVRSQGIPVEQHAVTVKGKEYWRVQVAGFATAGEARSRAELIREQLELPNVWVTKR